MRHQVVRVEVPQDLDILMVATDRTQLQTMRPQMVDPERDRYSEEVEVKVNPVKAQAMVAMLHMATDLTAMEFIPWFLGWGEHEAQVRLDL